MAPAAEVFPMAARVVRVVLIGIGHSTSLIIGFGVTGAVVAYLSRTAGRLD